MASLDVVVATANDTLYEATQLPPTPTLARYADGDSRTPAEPRTAIVPRPSLSHLASGGGPRITEAQLALIREQQRLQGRAMDQRFYRNLLCFGCTFLIVMNISWIQYMTWKFVNNLPPAQRLSLRTVGSGCTKRPKWRSRPAILPPFAGRQGLRARCKECNRVGTSRALGDLFAHASVACGAEPVVAAFPKYDARDELRRETASVRCSSKVAVHAMVRLYTTHDPCRLLCIGRTHPNQSRRAHGHARTPRSDHTPTRPGARRRRTGAHRATTRMASTPTPTRRHLTALKRAAAS